MTEFTDVPTLAPSCECSEAKLPTWGQLSSKNASAFLSSLPLYSSAPSMRLHTLQGRRPWPHSCLPCCVHRRAGQRLGTRLWLGNHSPTPSLGRTVSGRLAHPWPTPGCLGLEPRAHLRPHGAHTIPARSRHSQAHLTAWPTYVAPVCSVHQPHSSIWVLGHSEGPFSITPITRTSRSRFFT